MSIINVWKTRNQIFEGIKNSIFTKDTVEAISKERVDLCKSCENYDVDGKHCVVPRTGPCCGKCGCSLHLATRSLNYKCPINKWPVYISDDESVELSMLVKYKSELDDLLTNGKISTESYERLHEGIFSNDPNVAGYSRMQIRMIQK